jgi:signal recognition particle subunit SRP68
MHLKSLMSEDPASATGSIRSQVVSRFHKAQKHAFELYTLLESPESNATSNDLLEAAAYVFSFRGLEAFEKKHWEEALRAFAVSRTIYSVLSTNTKNEVYQEQLVGTVDPSIRYSAYQLQLPRSMDIVAISRQYFLREDSPRIVEAIEKLDSQAFTEQMDVDVPEAGSVTSVTWRGRTASVEEADISIALYEAHTAEAAYNSQEQQGSTDAFDAVLLAWQDAVDATRKAIDERKAEGMSTTEQKMQNLRLIWTVVNYSMICWRVGRNRVMISNIMSGPKKPKKDGQAPSEEVSGKKLGHLKEEIALYDAILQV